MSHPRQAIREAVVALLRNANTAAGDRVYPTREVPWKRVELPGIAVYALDETSEQSAQDAPVDRTLTVAVLIVESLTESIDAALDDLSLAVENAMRADATLNGAALSLYHTGTKIDVTEEQGRPLGAARLTYEIRYLTEP